MQNKASEADCYICKAKATKSITVDMWDKKVTYRLCAVCYGRVRDSKTDEKEVVIEVLREIREEYGWFCKL